jgi:O-antigen/teichoic acid export membrane protein
MPFATLRRRAAWATFAGSTSSTLVATVQSLVLMPLYLSQIGANAYGAWLASGELLGLLLAFDAGIPNLMIQRIGAALAKGDQREIGGYFGTGLAVLVAFALLIGSLLIAGAGHVPGLVGMRGQEAEALVGAFRIGAVAFSLMLVTFAFQGLARGLQQTAVVHGAVFAGTVAGFVVTAGMLAVGYGLLSIAAGLLVRSSVAALGCLHYLFLQVDPEIRRSIRFDRSAGRDYRKLSPPLFLSGLGFLATNNSQVLLAAILLGPGAAAVYGITRKAAEFVTAFLGAVSNATYGGFSHLYAEGNRERAKVVYGEIVALYLSLGLALLGAYLAVNPSLVGVWASADLYGGAGLCILIACSHLLSGWAYLENSLYRATGQHRWSSNAMLAYCFVRTSLAVGLTVLLGAHGLPASSVIASTALGFWVRARMRRELPSENRTQDAAGRTWALRVGVFLAGVGLCLAGLPASWTFVLAAGGATAAVSLALFLALDPTLHRYAAAIRRRALAWGGSG